MSENRDMIWPSDSFEELKHRYVGSDPYNVGTFILLTKQFMIRGFKPIDVMIMSSNYTGILVGRVIDLLDDMIIHEQNLAIQCATLGANPKTLQISNTWEEFIQRYDLNKLDIKIDKVMEFLSIENIKDKFSIGDYWKNGTNMVNFLIETYNIADMFHINYALHAELDLWVYEKIVGHHWSPIRSDDLKKIEEDNFEQLMKNVAMRSHDEICKKLNILYVYLQLLHKY